MRGTGESRDPPWLRTYCSIVMDDATCRTRVCSHQTPPCGPNTPLFPLPSTSLNPCIAKKTMNEGKRERAVGRAMFSTASREDPAGESRKRGPRLSPSMTRKLFPIPPSPSRLAAPGGQEHGADCQGRSRRWDCGEHRGPPPRQQYLKDRQL